MSQPLIETDMRICDAHHHLWDHIDPPYLLADLVRDIGPSHNVVSSVYVEARSHYRTDGPLPLRPVGETEWVTGLGQANGLVAGIVGFADLTLGQAVEEVLAAHITAGQGRFRGVRHPSAWDPHPQIRNAACDPPPQMLALPSFRDGIAVLGQLDLKFDAWL